jgi:hypothetical protein
MRAENKLDLIKTILEEDMGYYNKTYEAIDSVVVNSLKENIYFLSDPSNDPFETPDNKARCLASFYQVLSYYLTPEEYTQFVEWMRDK